MTSDPIGDMITRIKNAQSAGKPLVSIPFSNLKWAVAEELRRAGFLKSLSKKGKKVKKFIEAELIYTDGKPRITAVKRVSKPSVRVYHRVSDIRPVRQGYGIAVYSTPKGVLLDQAAREAGVGGEILFTLW